MRLRRLTRPRPRPQPLAQLYSRGYRSIPLMSATRVANGRDVVDIILGKRYLSPRLTGRVAIAWIAGWSGHDL